MSDTADRYPEFWLWQLRPYSEFIPFAAITYNSDSQVVSIIDFWIEIGSLLIKVFSVKPDYMQVQYTP